MDEILSSHVRARIAHFVIDATSILDDVRRLKLEIATVGPCLADADEDTRSAAGVDDLWHRLGLVAAELARYRGSPDPVLARADQAIDAYEIDRDLTTMFSADGP